MSYEVQLSEGATYTATDMLKPVESQSLSERIKEAIEKNGGEIDDKISKAITEINNRVDTELAAMNERIE